MILIQLVDSWRADDKFSWINFYFIAVKEFKKILEVFWRIDLNIFSGYYCEC